jgi:dihydrodipicolinate synthase/N-acetylneuraminate lyase
MVEEPFVLHNDPELIKTLDAPFKRSNIRTGILKDLTDIGNVTSLIFLGSLDRAHNYQKAVRSRTEFRIYDGDEANFLQHPSVSGVVSIGANLSPRAWQRITAASLNLAGNRKDYPDRLQQIWNLGEYLHKLKDIYEGNAVPLIKQVLSEMKVIENPACSFKAENLAEKTEMLKQLMKVFGDYP